MTFLEILTRCYKRPELLERNQASLAAQMLTNWQQTLLIDPVGRGIPWASENMGNYAPKLQGEYIWILDDDDECIQPTLFMELYRIHLTYNPDVIMLKMDHGRRGILPDEGYWGRPPVQAHIGVSAYVVRRELWQQQAWAWSPGVYHSDFNFIAAVFQSRPRVYWHNVIASQVQRISLGQPERI